MSRCIKMLKKCISMFQCIWSINVSMHLVKYFQRRFSPLQGFDRWDRQSSTSDNHSGLFYSNHYWLDHPHHQIITFIIIIIIIPIITIIIMQKTKDSDAGMCHRVSGPSSWQSHSLSGNLGKNLHIKINVFKISERRPEYLKNIRRTTKSFPGWRSGAGWEALTISK